MNREDERRQHKIVVDSTPDLKEGVNLVEKPDKMPVFQALVARELEGKEASAVWIDAGNEASTYALSSHGSERLLEKVSIGRAFTPFQHHSLVQNLEQCLDENTEVLVLPKVSLLYFNGGIREWEAEELFRETWKNIKRLQNKYDLKILVSLPENPEMEFIVKGDMVNVIKVKDTSEGWNYASKDYKTSYYRDGSIVQTTMPYWTRQKSSKTKLESPKVV